MRDVVQPTDTSFGGLSTLAVTRSNVTQILAGGSTPNIEKRTLDLYVGRAFGPSLLHLAGWHLSQKQTFTTHSPS